MQYTYWPDEVKSCLFLFCLRPLVNLVVWSYKLPILHLYLPEPWQFSHKDWPKMHRILPGIKKKTSTTSRKLLYITPIKLANGFLAQKNSEANPIMPRRKEKKLLGIVSATSRENAPYYCLSRFE